MTGWALLNPGALIALAALALPIMIHLFSRSRGRRVLVGNIDFYRQPRRQRVFELRVVQWPLLLLRLLTLAVAALLLADLARPERLRLPGDTSYVTPAWLESADRATKETIADEVAAGRVYVLAPGLPPLNGGTQLPEDPTTDAMSLLAQRFADTEHLGNVTVHAVASTADFPGRLPSFGNGIDWRLITNAAEPSGDWLPALDVAIHHSPDRAADAALAMRAVVLLNKHRQLQLSATKVVEDSRSDFLQLRAGDSAWRVDREQLHGELFPDVLSRWLAGNAGWFQGFSNATVDPTPQLAQPAIKQPLPMQSLSHWLAALLALLVAVERWMSERAHRGAPAP